MERQADGFSQMVWDKIFPDTARQYVVELGWKTDKFFPPILPLTILIYSSIQVDTRISVHPILVDTEEFVIGDPEEDLEEVNCYH